MNTKVIHLHFKQPVEGSGDYYFTSIAAIYDLFAREQVGITYMPLARRLASDGYYENKLCTVRVAPLRSKAQRNKHQPKEKD